MTLTMDLTFGNPKLEAFFLKLGGVFSWVGNGKIW